MVLQGNKWIINEGLKSGCSRRISVHWKLSRKEMASLYWPCKERWALCWWRWQSTGSGLWKLCGPEGWRRYPGLPSRLAAALGWDCNSSDATPVLTAAQPSVFGILKHSVIQHHLVLSIYHASYAALTTGTQCRQGPPPGTCSLAGRQAVKYCNGNTVTEVLLWASRGCTRITQQLPNPDLFSFWGFQGKLLRRSAI